MKEPFKTAGNSPPASTTNRKSASPGSAMLFNHLVRKITTAKRAACSTSYLFCHVPPGILVHVTNYEGFGVDQCDLEVNLVGAKSEGAR